MTPKQKQLLDYIGGYWQQHGRAPKYDEMRIHCGLASKSGIHRMIVGLEERGYVVRHPDRWNSVHLAGEDELARQVVAAIMKLPPQARPVMRDILRTFAEASLAQSRENP